MTTEHTFNQGDMVFDEDGNAFEFVAHMDGVGTIARPWYEFHDDDGAPCDRIGETAVVIVGALYPECPSPKRRADIERLDGLVAAKKAELAQIETALREANAGRDAMLKRIKENDALRRIDAFLAGEITHYVLYGEHYQMDIVAVGETIPEYAKQGALRLLSLTASMVKPWGSKEATLRWDLNRYSDGSGHATACVPCTSFDEAKAVLAEKVASKFAEWEAGKSVTFIQYVASAAKKFGLPVPQKYRDQEASAALSQARAGVADAEKKLAEARTRLAAVSPAKAEEAA